MAAPTKARAAALRVLRDARGGMLADRALDEAAASFDARDRAFLQELVYGTFRLRGRIDHILGRLSSRPLDRLAPDVLDVLRLGAYQLLEMGGVPPYAAVSESVELARAAGADSATGFVNGVLQALRRADGRFDFPPFEKDPVAHLTTWGSHPRWLVRRWIDRYGAEEARRLVEADNRRPESFLRLLGDVGAARAALDAAGIGCAGIPDAPRVVRLTTGDPAAALQAGPVIVQDPAAGAVVDFVAPPADAVILDIAAAPGGKALALAAGDPAPALVAAADVSFRRMKRLRGNRDRLDRPPPRGPGALPLAMVVADGRRPPFRPCDVVLIDAPCTGTGTLRRHPDGRWRLRPEDLVALTELQAELLEAAAALVAPGGLLVYATCSLEPEENEVQVQAFVERHPVFTVEPGPAPEAALVDGMLNVLPQRHGFDGAFAARMRRGG